MITQESISLIPLTCFDCERYNAYRMTHPQPEADYTDARKAFLHRVDLFKHEDLQPQYFDTDPDAIEMRNTMPGVFRSTQFKGFMQYANEYPHDLPPGYISWLSQQGLTRFEIPTEFGGAPISNQGKGVAIEEGDVMHPGLILDAIVAGGSLTAFEIAEFGTQQQQNEYLRDIAEGKIICAYALTEPNHGSDARHIETHAEKVSGGWEITGTKMFTTLGEKADVIVMAVITDRDGTPGENMSIFLVNPKNRVSGDIFFQKYKKVGQPGSPLSQIDVKKFFVPDSAVLGGKDTVNKGWPTIQKILAHSRTQIAEQGVGIAQGSINDAIAYAKERVMFGDKLINLPMTLNRLRVMNRQTNLARKVSQLAAFYEDMHHDRAFVVASLAKLSACATGFWAASEAFGIFGGVAYLQNQEFDIYGRVRDAIILLTYEGTDAVQKLILESNGMPESFYAQFMPPPVGAGQTLDPNTILSPQKAHELIKGKMLQIGLPRESGGWWQWDPQKYKGPGVK